MSFFIRMVFNPYGNDTIIVYCPKCNKEGRLTKCFGKSRHFRIYHSREKNNICKVPWSDDAFDKLAKIYAEKRGVELIV